MHLNEGRGEISPAIAESAARWLAKPTELAAHTARLYRDIIREAVDNPTRKIIEAIMGIEQQGYESPTFRRVYGEGLQEGREEGREEGEITALRRVLRRTLTRRFGALTQEQEHKLDVCNSVDRLEGWLDASITADSAEQTLSSSG